MKNLFTKELKFENIILLVLGITATIIGILILTNVISLNDFIDNPTLFSYLLIGLGVISLVLSSIKLFKKSKNQK